MRWKLKTAAVITPLILGACTAPVLPVNYSARDAGFAAVEARTSKAIGKRTVWAHPQTAHRRCRGGVPARADASGERDVGAGQ